jgi:hypothetical protein
VRRREFIRLLGGTAVAARGAYSTPRAFISAQSPAQLRRRPDLAAHAAVRSEKGLLLDLDYVPP